MRSTESDGPILADASSNSVPWDAPRKLTIIFSVPRVSSLLILVPIALYALFAVYRIDTPGLQYDESLFINAALGNLDGSFVVFRLPIFGHDLVLMCMPYIGALKSWIFSPIFALFGVSAITIRLPAVLLGSGAIALTFLYVRRLFDQNVAAIASVLLALDPSYIFGTRLDWGPVAMMSLLKSAFLYIGLRAWAENSRRLSALSGLLLGLGIFDKTNFGWLLIAVGASLFCCYPRASLQKARQLGMHFAIGFILAIIPLVIYNVAVPFGTLANRLNDTMPFLSALVQRIGVFHTVLDGEAIMTLVSSGQIGSHVTPYEAPETAIWIAFQAAIATIFACAFVRRRIDKRIVFIASLLGFIVLLIAVTPNATGPHHALFAYPFPHVLIAYAAVQLAYLIRDRVTFARPYVYGFLAFLLLSVAGSEAIADSAYLGNFVSTGGSGAWSDKIYMLERVLPENGDRVALMDWGFDTQLNGLSRDRILHEESFVELLDPSESDVDARIARIIARNRIFVFHSRIFALYPLVRERFDEYLSRHHIRASIREIREEDGLPVYDVISVGSGSVQPAAASEYVPKPAAQANKTGIVFFADPVDLSSGQQVGVTNLHWSTPYKTISIFVGRKDGILFTNQDGVGSAQTGPWATDGMKFYLERETRQGDPKSTITVAIAVVHRASGR